MFENVVLEDVDNQFVRNSLPQNLCTARMSVGATFPLVNPAVNQVFSMSRNGKNP